MAAIVLSLGLILTAYLLGSIPWGLVLTRWVAAEDIRTRGSGNIGATNVVRVAGKAIGALTLVLDMLKGGLPVYWALGVIDHIPHAWGEMLVAVVALSAFFGHLFPLFLRFKTGGKGVATAFGCFLAIVPIACGCAMAVFCLMVWRFHYVSAGSLAASLTLPVFIAFWGNSNWLIFAAVVMAVSIFIRHAANIKRLLRGTEPVFGTSLKK
ncbi:MAG: glycerol-3-phosphate 1-O-acyltransferase PlsY [Pseudomonadota bacterium]